MDNQTKTEAELKADIEQAINGMRSTDILARIHAEDALTKIGAPAVESLIVLLRDANFKDKREIAETLGKIRDERAMGPLVDLVETWIRCVEKYLSTHDLMDRDIEAEFNAHAAIRALGQFGEPMLGYLEQISRKNGLVWGSISVVAAEEATAVRRKMAGLPDLRGLLASIEFGDPKSRTEALNQLTEIGDSSTLPGLEKLLNKFQDAEREAVRAVIEKIKQRIKPA